ncbi:AAA family ATPase [Streptomyces sp. NPDC048290]|uniref:helix-turn-helix transcriptional regulator n=1 Tax=Streptomyces sp. NPDC048290 TaxID=3155811 RepID=UPI003438E1B7
MEPAALGRGPLWAVVRDALGDAGRHGRALWLRGDAGTGKTVLLEQAARYAATHGVKVLRAAGSRGERELPFGVLHQLLWALPRDTGALPAAARAALDRALGGDPGDPGAPYCLAAATAELLADAARTRPVALLVDDLHWTDDASADVLRAVQRRLPALPVVLVAALRQDPGAARLDPTGADILDLTPLDDPGARALLRARHPDLADAARDRVLQEAAGNPLALVELPAQLTASERAGRAPLPDHLPLGERLTAVFTARLAVLPARTRFTLLLSALAGPDGPTADAVARAATASGATGAHQDLRIAAHAGLVQPDGPGVPASLVRFRHPLVRSALVAAASGAERRRAHAAWAAVLPPDGLAQVTHRAAATAVADEPTAEALERAALRALTRAGDAEAAGLLVQAARLSEDPAARGRRLTAAASAAVRGGRIELADRLLDRTDPHEVPAADLPVLHLTRALVRLQADGDIGPALTLLPGVLDTGPGPLVPRAHLLLLLAAGHSTEPDVWATVAPRLAAAPALVRLAHDVWHDPARRAHAGAARLAAAVREFTDESDDVQAWLLLWCAAGLDAVGDHAALWERLARRHSYPTRSFVSAATAYDDYLRGHWDRGVAHARAGTALARARGYRFTEYVHRCQEGYVRAARGEKEAVDALVADLLPWAEARGLGMVVLRLRGFQAMCALASGDPETAYAHAAAVTPPGTLPPGVAPFHLTLLDLVEAAVLTGRTTEARRHTAAARTAGAQLISPHHAFVLLAAEALAGDDLDTSWTAVYTADRAADWPFELARVRLHHGIRLRRRGRRAEARARLRAAHDTFAALDAGPWTARAAQELRVCDDPGGEPGTAVAGLSPQELRIAELVADGLTNRDIGVRLQISPRTVSSHLYRIYPKLGVTSRAAVARALTERGRDG